ncbi:MAG: putative integral membrane protein (TIGR00697 family) [Chlamydiales bacterium]
MVFGLIAEKENSYIEKNEKLYLILATTFCVVLVVSNMVGLKLFRLPFFPSIALPSGAITYPLTFLLTDLVSEIWGKKKANFMVFLGFGMSLLMLFVIQIVLCLPPHEIWVSPENSFGYLSVGEYQTAYESVFSISGTLIFASMSAYMTAQLIDIRIFHFFKNKTNGRHLWLRNNASTFISQFFDTLIVNSIVLFWGLGMEFPVGLQIMSSVYLYKVVFAIFDTPIVYLGVAVIKRILNK